MPRRVSVPAGPLLLPVAPPEENTDLFSPPPSPAPRRQKRGEAKAADDGRHLRRFRGLQGPPDDKNLNRTSLLVDQSGAAVGVRD